MLLYIVKRGVDAFQHHKKVCRRTRCRSCGIQHQVAHAFVEVFAFICDILYGSSVDAYQYGIGKRNALSFDDFFVVVIQQLLIVRYSVAHTLVGGVHVQTGS